MRVILAALCIITSTSPALAQEADLSRFAYSTRPTAHPTLLEYDRSQPQFRFGPLSATLNVYRVPSSAPFTMLREDQVIELKAWVPTTSRLEFGIQGAITSGKTIPAGTNSWRSSKGDNPYVDGKLKTVEKFNLTYRF